MDKNRLAKLNSLFDAISIVAEGAYVYLCDMRYDMSRWSKAAVDYFNMPSEYIENAGAVWEEKVHPDDRAVYAESINAIFNGDATDHEMQYRALAADNTYTVCSCRGIIIRDDNGEPEYFGGVIRNHGLYNFVDPITGLRSLYGYLDDIKGLFTRRQPTLIIMVGLSAFSDINDVYGYEFGNRVLQELTVRIKELFKGHGEIYRMDGIRFAVITHDITPDEAADLYDKLKDSLKKNFIVDDERINLTLNGGAIMADCFDVACETFYSCLRYAYYESKHNKCGGFVLFDDVVNVENRRVIAQVNTIRSCIANDYKGFYLCYQPIVDSATEKLHGMEALVRWKNEVYGVVSPDKFIPVLEQDALFPELGRWILKQAMTDGKRFLELDPELIINVNLSYTQLEKSGFVNELFELIEETGFPMRNLCLEITERCRLLDTAMLKDIFAILRERGIRIAVDDFGTGFSSLGFLRSVPVDVVKIDREFVKDIEHSAKDKYSVKFISELAGAFDADVCAEGIETNDVRDCLKEYKISSLQGYLYSKPITADEMLDKIKS